jgi:hypothetical protein
MDKIILPMVQINGELLLPDRVIESILPPFTPHPFDLSFSRLLRKRRLSSRSGIFFERPKASSSYRRLHQAAASGTICVRNPCENTDSWGY